jgi:hypothetical protein
MILLLLTYNTQSLEPGISSISNGKGKIFWSIYEDKLILIWNHSIKKPSGYYVQIEEFSAGKTQSRAPKSAPITSSSSILLRSEIHGLKPHTDYLIKVVAYNDHHKSESSETIQVDTTKLGFYKAKNLKVKDVRDIGATFSWEQNESNNVHDIEYKVSGFPC